MSHNKATLTLCAARCPDVPTQESRCRRNPFKVTEDTTRSFRTGRSHTAKAGDFGTLTTSGANVDPAIFGSDAMEFRPGRENADRLLTWNNELRDIRSCGKHST